jgi:hypothetical protein
MLIWFRHGRKVVLPLLAGAGISFFIADPFLWFIPIQHIADLLRKFTMHYSQSLLLKMELPFFVDAIWLSAVSFVWAFVLLRQQRLAQIMPIPIIIVFSSISILALVGVFSSKFQATRYLFPLIIVWEVFLPLFILETLIPTNSIESSIDSPPQITTISSSVIGLVILMQLLAYLNIWL